MAYLGHYIFLHCRQHHYHWQGRGEFLLSLFSHRRLLLRPYVWKGKIIIKWTWVRNNPIFNYNFRECSQCSFQFKLSIYQSNCFSCRVNSLWAALIFSRLVILSENKILRLVWLAATSQARPLFHMLLPTKEFCYQNCIYHGTQWVQRRQRPMKRIGERRKDAEGLKSNSARRNAEKSFSRLKWMLCELPGSR
mgnify:CR=1 FL=1